MSNLPGLIQEFEGFGEYQILNFAFVSDGYGGTIPTWIEGPKFEATVTLDDSVAMKTAQAQGVKGIYRVATQRSVRLPWHTVFKSLSTGNVYRVTSKDESATPARATIDIRYVSAEEYTLTTDPVTPEVDENE